MVVAAQGVAFATLASGLPSTASLVHVPRDHRRALAIIPRVVGPDERDLADDVRDHQRELAAPFTTPTFVSLVLTLNLMESGPAREKLGLGVARLGSMVDFISTAVVIRSRRGPDS